MRKKEVDEEAAVEWLTDVVAKVIAYIGKRLPTDVKIQDRPTARGANQSAGHRRLRLDGGKPGLC